MVWNSKGICIRRRRHPESMTTCPSHTCPRGSRLGEQAAIRGEISCVGPQARHWITHHFPPLRRPVGGGANKQRCLPPANPVVLLDQTPLIETALFMKENVPHKHACTHRHRNCNVTVLQLKWSKLNFLNQQYFCSVWIGKKTSCLPNRKTSLTKGHYMDNLLMEAGLTSNNLSGSKSENNSKN